MANVEVWTFEDAVEHVLDVFDLDNSTRNKRIARRAILQAYRDLPNMRSWNYYYRRKPIFTVANYNTGTISYDHTGGSSERLVTLTSGTFPTWAARGRIIINNVHYDVESYLTSTTITLTASGNPGEDVAAGSTYNLYRNTYPLPADYRKSAKLYDITQWREMPLATPVEQQVVEGSYYRDPGTPKFATIKNDGDYYGNMSISFTPPPSSVKAYDLMYEARPRELATEKYDTGTVSVASTTTTTVTGSSTVFAAAHVGSIIRFSSDSTNAPTSLVGIRANNLINPYLAQRVILSVSTATSLTMDAAIPNVLAGVKYTISDPIDLEAGAMLTAFWRMAELEMAKLTTRNDVGMREQLARAAILAAMEADERSTVAAGQTSWSAMRLPTITSIG